jgi:hypothetical protein
LAGSVASGGKASLASACAEVAGGESAPPILYSFSASRNQNLAAHDRLMGPVPLLVPNYVLRDF